MKILSLILLIQYSICLKILILGDLDQVRRPYFEKLGYYLASFKQNNVYFLSDKILTLFKAKDKTNQRFQIYGLPVMIQEKKNRNFTLQWRFNETEQENFYRLEQEQIEFIFSDPLFLNGVWRENFDVGIGGLSYSDTMFFRQIDLVHVKVSIEEIEAFTMQMKLEMPISTSTYPSLQIFNQFSQQQNIPEFNSFFYRFQFFWNYQINKIKLYLLLRQYKKSISWTYNNNFDKHDQIHALVVGEGTTNKLIQSSMGKPQNIVNVYPLIRNQIQQIINLNEEVIENVKQINIFNLEIYNPVDSLFLNEEKLKVMIEQIKLFQEQNTFNLIIWQYNYLNLTINDSYIQNYFDEISKLKSDYFQILELNNSFSYKIKNIENLTVNYISSCTQENFLFSIEYYNVNIFSYQNINSDIQQYNCKKLEKYNYGIFIDDISLLYKKVQESQITKSQKENIYKLQQLLLEEKYKNSKDLQYWLEYCKMFGISHKIPRYDKMNFLIFYNLDIFIYIYLTYITVKYLINKLRNKCKEKSEKVKTD